MKLERLRQDFETATRKAAKWQARARELEKQITEQENLEIIQAVRSITAKPEELRAILARIQASKTGENTPPPRAERAVEPKGAQEQHENKT